MLWGTPTSWFFKTRVTVVSAGAVISHLSNLRLSATSSRVMAPPAVEPESRAPVVEVLGGTLSATSSSLLPHAMASKAAPRIATTANTLTSPNFSLPIYWSLSRYDPRVDIHWEKPEQDMNMDSRYACSRDAYSKQGRYLIRKSRPPK